MIILTILGCFNNVFYSPTPQPTYWAHQISTFKRLATSDKRLITSMYTSGSRPFSNNKEKGIEKTKI